MTANLEDWWGDSCGAMLGKDNVTYSSTVFCILYYILPYSGQIPRKSVFHATFRPGRFAPFGGLTSPHRSELGPSRGRAEGGRANQPGMTFFFPARQLASSPARPPQACHSPVVPPYP